MINKEDVAAELIRNSQAGYICDHSEALTSIELAQFIENIYQDWKEKRLPSRNWDLIKHQSREAQISKLISALKVSR